MEVNQQVKSKKYEKIKMYRLDHCKYRDGLFPGKFGQKQS
jgi:hypothetical protein